MILNPYRRLFVSSIVLSDLFTCLCVCVCFQYLLCHEAVRRVNLSGVMQLDGDLRALEQFESRVGLFVYQKFIFPFPPPAPIFLTVVHSDIVEIQIPLSIISITTG